MDAVRPGRFLSASPRGDASAARVHGARIPSGCPAERTHHSLFVHSARMDLWAASSSDDGKQSGIYIHVQVFTRTRASFSRGEMPRRGTTGSQGTFMFNGRTEETWPAACAHFRRRGGARPGVRAGRPLPDIPARFLCARAPCRAHVRARRPSALFPEAALLTFGPLLEVGASLGVVKRPQLSVSS